MRLVHDRGPYQGDPRRGRLVLTVFLAATLTVAACAPQGEVATPTSFAFDDETVYLDSVRMAEKQWRDALGRVQQILLSSYGTRSVMFAAFEVADFTEVSAEILGAVASISDEYQPLLGPFFAEPERRR